MAAFSLQLDLAKEVNRHFLANEYGDLSFFSVVLNWVINFSVLNKYGPILSVEQNAIVGNVNLASNRNYNHGAIIRIYMGIYKVLLLLNEHGDPSFLFQNLSSYNKNKNLSAGSISAEWPWGHSPVLHCASLLRIIYGVISARSCTRTLKTWRICLDIEFCQLKYGYSSLTSSDTPNFFSVILIN